MIKFIVEFFEVICMLITQLKENLNRSSKYFKYMVKWVLLSIVLGTVCGLSGVLFHYAVEYATEFRFKYPLLICTLPIAGVLIVFLYHICKMQNDKGTNTVINSIRSGEKVPILMAPLILIGTTLTHLGGGSSGREGAALQIGGSIGSFLGRTFRLSEKDVHVMVMCGMSAVFSAVFGTPVTAAVFSIEVVSVGIMYYNAFFPCMLSAALSHAVAVLFNVHSAGFNLPSVPQIGSVVFLKVVLLSVLCALLSSLFIISMHKYSALSSKFIPNPYIKAAVGGVIVALITLLLGTSDYNGVGMPVIKAAVESGFARPEAFILKLVLTVVTLSSGFKGGEILPSFFIGSTFGAFAASFLGLDPAFSAAVGLIAMFCGVVNCPLASILMSVELFGGEGLPLFAIAVGVSYVVSGYYSLYSGQKIMYSKLQSSFMDMHTK